MMTKFEKLFIALVMAFSTTSCSHVAGQITVSAPAKPKETPAQTKETPKPAQEASSQTTTTQVQPGSGDYFPAGVKIVAGNILSFMGTLYTAKFYTATVVTEPSAATKGEGLVRMTWEVREGKELEMPNQEHWTPYIADTRPAKEEDFVVGALVFATGDTHGRTPEKLAQSTEWGLRRIKDVSELYKGIVITEYFDSYWNQWKEWHYHKNNIRAIIGEFSADLRK